MMREALLAWRTQLQKLPAAPGFRPPALQQTRQLASRRRFDDHERDRDVSWGEILQGAASIGSTIGGKIASTVKRAIGAVLPSISGGQPPTKTPRTASQQPAQIKIPAGMFGTGILGRVVASVAERALSGVTQQLQQQLEESERMQQSARCILQQSRQVADRLGPVQVGESISHSISQTVVNGQAVRHTTTTFPVEGTRGRAMATLIQGNDTQKIKLDFSDGSSLRLGSDSDINGSDNGRVIDAEYRDAV